MDTETIKKNLSASFDILKDSWKIYKEAITLCIAEMMKYDGELAINMWLYILKKNKVLLVTDDGTNQLISDIIDMMLDVRYNNSQRTDELLVNDIVPYMLKKSEILDIIFGKACCTDTSSFNSFLRTTSMCFSYILILGDSDIITHLLKLLYSNMRIKGFSPGIFIYETMEELDVALYNQKAPYNSLRKDIADALMYSLDNIQNPLLKAECTVFTISLIQLCSDKHIL